MGKSVALVTGACGEMGHLLLPALKEHGHDVVALDLRPLDAPLRALCIETVEASILDGDVLDRLLREHRPELVFHLAALLSSRAEDDPELAHRVNVGGTVELMLLCRTRAREENRSIRFLFPSSIAVHGLPDLDTKKRAGAVREEEWTLPSGMYGCNKLYCELIGSYYTRRAQQRGEPGLDFRAIRFPGLISAETLPTGGTSDYLPEMIHAAARGEPYACFVRPDTRLPFMTMVDAVEAFLKLAEAPAERLTTRVYGIRAFNPSAEEFRRRVLEHFPDAEITFTPREHRQRIVDSWPEDLDDSRARSDWGLAPRHGLREALADHLVPALKRRYAVRAGSGD